MNNEKYICPICGYDKLDERPYDGSVPSYEICPCCGFEYGYDDYDSGYTFEIYRDKWIEDGAKWFTESEKPKDWNIVKQLNNLSGYIFEKNQTCGPYAEIQYCENKVNTYVPWKKDSLYFVIGNSIYNDIFYPNFAAIFNCADFPNGEVGFDPHGINYYSPEQTKDIYKQIKENENLPDRKVLLDWLKVAVDKNIGFYIFGA